MFGSTTPDGTPTARDQSPPHGDALLSVRHISKRFGATIALKDVTFDLHGGEIVGLLGENGAGKSTLISILSGVLQPDSGDIHVAGRTSVFNDAHAAQVSGIATVYQHFALAPHMNVAENLFLGRTGSLTSIMRPARLRDRASRILADLGWNIDVHREVGSLPISDQQLVEIARAIASDARVLLLDEPTSSLSTDEIDVLIRRVRALARTGIAVIFVSHQMDEIFDLADSFVVLRDGQVAMRCRKEDTDRRSVVRAMLGASTARAAATDQGSPTQTPQKADAEHALEVEGLTRQGMFRGVSFTVGAGEVVALTGLRGCGAVEAAASIFDQAGCSGRVRCLGHYGPMKISELIRIGAGYVPADRAGGLFPDLSVRENLNLAARVAGIPISQAAEPIMKLLAIRARDARSPVRDLSGGNRQKVLIGRWLVTAVKALILIEPTRGVDIGARADIHRIIRHLAESGVGILIGSLDAEEIEAVSDRVLVMHDGTIAAELHSPITAKHVLATVAETASTKARAV